MNVVLWSAAQNTLGDCDPNPLETETASNSDQNDGVGPCLEADSNASVQCEWNNVKICLMVNIWSPISTSFFTLECL